MWCFNSLYINTLDHVGYCKMVILLLSLSGFFFFFFGLLAWIHPLICSLVSYSMYRKGRINIWFFTFVYQFWKWVGSLSASNVNNFLLLYHFELFNLNIFDMFQSFAIFILIEVHIISYLAGEILFRLPEFF